MSNTNPMTRSMTRCGAVALLGLCAATASWADGNRRAGDVLSWALPLGAAGYSLYDGDREGTLQFGKAFAVTLAGTEVLKRTTHVERPDHSDDKSFPSGHASRAFSAATFVHRRYGFEAALPMYAAATYVGWTRVHADQHRWRDVAGSAVLSAAASWWLVDPRQDRRVSVLPLVGPRSVGVEVAASW